MHLLLIEHAPSGNEEMAAAARMIAGKHGRVTTLATGDIDTLASAAVDYDLAILAGDDNDTRLLQTLRAISARTKLPVIVVGLSASVDSAVALLKAGACDYVARDDGNAWIDRLREGAAEIRRARRELPSKRQQAATPEGNDHRLAQIVDGSSVAMFVIDRQHCVSHWNRACEALTGIAATSVVGTREHWRAFYRTPRPCLADLIIDGAGEGDAARYYSDKGFRASDLIPGSYEAEDFFPAFGDGGRWLFFTAAPLFGDDGEIVGAIETLQDITARKQAQEALRANEMLLRQIIQCSSVATFVIDREHKVSHWNRACETLLGLTADSTIGTLDLASTIYGERRPVLADLVLEDADDATLQRYYGDRFRRSSGMDGVVEVDGYFELLPAGPRWLHFAAAPLHDERGRTVGAIETLIDITERKLAEERIQESEQRLAQIIDGSAVAAFVIDHEHRLTHWNKACAALTGVPASEVIGTRQQWRAFYPAERPCLADLVVEAAREQMSHFYGSKKIHPSRIVDGGYEAEDFFPAFGNSGRWLYFTAAPLYGAAGQVIGAIETLQDVTEQKRAEEQLRQSEERYRVLSITDGMTGLYNARHFAQRLGEEMDRCQRYQHPLALMVMDVDDFKQFNDTWGHVQGDQVLIRLAECITSCLRRTDQAFRYGGEEFVALLPETDMKAASAAAERVRSMFAGSILSPGGGVTTRCTASIGVTLFIPGESPRDFVARADSGTYEAKRQGKNRVIPIPPLPAPSLG